MVAPNSTRCREQAYELFAAGVANLDSTVGLLKAATAINMHGDDSVTFEAIDSEIRTLAARVRCRLKTNHPSALLAHLHRVLFEEEGFDGNREDYYNPRNSYIASVLESRRGMPIALCLIYKCVAERLPIAVEGIGAPGHFLARVEVEGRAALIDPFYGGRVLTREEAIRRVEQTTGCTVPDCVDVLAPVTHRQWLERMLNNLQVVFAQNNCPADLAAMRELAALL